MLRARLLFAAVFVFAAALGVFYIDHNIGFTILYAMGLLLLLALVTILLAPRFIEIREESGAGNIMRGESVAYKLVIANRSPFLYAGASLSLCSGDVVEYGDELSRAGALLPFGRSERSATLSFPYRGDYPLGVKKLVVTDFLGLFRRTITSKTPLSALVYPAVDESFRMKLAEEPEGFSRRHGLWSEDYSSVTDVQKYAAADSLRKIHWQLSAARGELIVKNYPNYEQDRVVLFLDTGRLPLSGTSRAAFEDRMTACVAAAVASCAEAKLPAALLLGDRDGEETAVRDMTDAFRLLAAVPFDREPPPVPDIGRLADSRNLLLFLHGLDKRMFDAVAALVADGRSVTLYCFASPELPLSADARSRLDELGGYGAAVHVISGE